MSPTVVYGQRNADKFITGKNVDLVVVTCTCGLLFAIPEHLDRSARTHSGPNGWQISCPLGHTWHYNDGQSDEDKLRDQLERERRWSANVVARLDQTEASLSATKGVVTKLKKRVAAGVCPCCNRTFQQLARHMENKHPDFAEAGDHGKGHLPGDVEKPTDLGAAVLSFLGGEQRRWAEIRDHLGIRNNEAGNLIYKLVALREIERVSHGVYRRTTA